MNIKHKMLGEVLVVTVGGELDHNTAGYVREYLDNLFCNTTARQIVFDLNDLSFMDSTGIGVFIGRYKKMRTRGIPIFICNPSSHAKRIFDISGLFDIIPLIS